MNHAHRYCLIPLVSLLNGAALAASDPPTAVMVNGAFINFLSVGPVGNNNQQTDGELYWRRESSGMLYEGQPVDSWYVFYDPATTGNMVQGTITFASNILFTFTTVTAIIATNAYRDPILRYNFTGTGFANLEASDLANTVISGNTITLRWDAFGAADGDYMRVFTAASPVPEPASWALIAFGLIALGVAAAKRRELR